MVLTCARWTSIHGFILLPLSSKLLDFGDRRPISPYRAVLPDSILGSIGVRKTDRDRDFDLGKTTGRHQLWMLFGCLVLRLYNLSLGILYTIIHLDMDIN